MRPFSIFRRLQQTSAFLWFRFSCHISIQHFSSASQWVNEWKKFFLAEPYAFRLDILTSQRKWPSKNSHPRDLYSVFQKLIYVIQSQLYRVPRKSLKGFEKSYVTTLSLVWTFENIDYFNFTLSYGRSTKITVFAGFWAASIIQLFLEQTWEVVS
jgi:hypothetical protein